MPVSGSRDLDHLPGVREEQTSKVPTMNAQLTSPHIVLRITVNVFSLMAVATAAPAEIFQWEYINPANPGEGKRQSTTLAPSGAGVNAVPSADLSFRNLTMAYLIGADVHNASFYGATLTDADFSNAEIRGATFDKVIDCWSICYVGGTGVTLARFTRAPATSRMIWMGSVFLTTTLPAATSQTRTSLGRTSTAPRSQGADFTDAHVRGANFSSFYGTGTGITLAQLYSSASYQAHDLTGINLDVNFLSGQTSPVRTSPARVWGRQSLQRRISARPTSPTRASMGLG